MKILVANPNTSAGVTDLLVAAGRLVASPGTELIPMTARHGVPYIATRAEALHADDGLGVREDRRHTAGVEEENRLVWRQRAGADEPRAGAVVAHVGDDGEASGLPPAA